MSTDKATPNLLEKHPELKAAWQNDMAGSYRTLLREYEYHNRYQSVAPIAWRKPAAFTRADTALSELAATATITRMLATMANEESYAREGKTPAAEHYTAFALRFSRVESMITEAQQAMQTLAVLGEMRWLQHNVEGDFSRMPKSWRARYTNTPTLLSEHDFGEMKRLLTSPKEIAELWETADTAMANTMEALSNAQRYLCAEGPIYGFTWPEARALAEHDHKICTEILLPHMADQIAAAREEITTLNRYATMDGPLKLGGAAAPKVQPLGCKFREPSATDEVAPSPNNVTNILDARRLRDERDKSK